MSDPGITLQVMIRCVRRELAQRSRVYPRLVEQGRMTADAMNMEMATMRAVLANLEAQQAHVQQSLKGI